MAERRRSYKVGARETDFNSGKFSENRWAWTKNNLGQFVILVDPPTEESEAGNQIRLFHPIPKRPAVSLNLTSLTEEELRAMWSIFNDAFEWALPIVQQRDKDAQDAFERGDDSYTRVYRQVPQLVYRQRPEQPDSESILYGPSDAARMGSLSGESVSAEPDDGGVRVPGDPVAQRDEAGSSAEDDEPASDKPEVVRPVGGPPPAAHGVPPAVSREGSTSSAPGEAG